MKNAKVYLRYNGAYPIQGRLWALNGGFNGLFSINLDDYTVEYKQRIPSLEKHAEWAGGGNGYCIYEKKIFFFPYNCWSVMVYDMQSNMIQEIPINVSDNSNAYWTAGIFQKEEKVWIFPTKMEQGIFILDMKRMQLERDMELEGVLSDVTFIYNFGNVIRLNGEEIAILSGKHSIIGIDVENKRKTFCKEFVEIDVWGIRYDGSDFWILQYESTDVYQWICNEDRLVRYRLLEEEWINGKGMPYVNMIFSDNQVFLLPFCLKYIMRVNRDTNKISKAVDYPENFCFFDGLMEYGGFLSFSMVDQHTALIHPVRGNMLLLYDMKTNHIEGKELTVTKEQVPYLEEVCEQKLRQESGIINEKDNFGLNLLDWCISKKRQNSDEVKTEQAGRKIYDTLVRKN